MVYTFVFRLLNVGEHFKRGCKNNKQVERSLPTTRSAMKSKRAHRSVALARI